jgi:alpha-tubulin suppressor-like RCC1 family protein
MFVQTQCKRVGSLLWILWVALAGCQGSGTYRLHLEFPDEESRSTIVQVHVWVLEPSGHNCEELISGVVKVGAMTSLSNVVLNPLAPDVGSSLRKVPAGDVLFYAEGQNATGGILLKGCSPGRVEGGKNLDVTVRLVWTCRTASEVEIPQNDVDDNCDGRTDECHAPEECNDLNVCTLDFCIEEGCQYLPAQDDPEDPTSCTSSNLCLLESHCHAGECVGKETDCRWFDGICLKGFCDPATGTCTQRQADDGVSCGGNNFCTENGSCINGECVGTPKQEGTPCDDYTFCNGTDACDDSGNCSTHSGTPCGVFSCNEENDRCIVGLGFLSITSGESHTCGLTAEGVAYCWGSDEYGQLGNGGTSEDTQSPFPVDTSTISGSKVFVHLSAGYTHTCGITVEGVAYCWGADNHGQLGNGGGSLDTQSPFPVDTSTIPGNKAFVQLTGGYGHTCGLTAEGVATCWGWDYYGQLGNGGGSLDTQSPFPVDTSTIPGNKVFVSITTGRSHTCGLTAEGVAYCWGRDNNGQLGNGGASLDTQSPSPVDSSTMTGNKAFVSIQNGVVHTCGLTVDGVAYCWGLDSRGQLGNGGGSLATQSPSPVDTSIILGNKAFVQMTAGGEHSCGLTADGVAYCWGSNQYGQLGNGDSAIDKESPSPVETSTIGGNKSFVKLSVRVDHTCGLTADGAAVCWGSDAHGQIGNGGGSQDMNSPSVVDTSTVGWKKAFVKLAAGIDYACGMTPMGTIYCWGSDAYGGLGNGGTSLDSQSPLPVDTSTIIGNKAFVQLDTGVSHTCAITAEGVVYCWGRDTDGQLGNGGASLDTQSPSPADTSTIPGNRVFVQLAGGELQTCGLTADGVAYCWGSDAYGQLGNGNNLDSTQSPSPVNTSTMPGNKTFVQLVAGDYHTCGLAADGLAYCWGHDSNLSNVGGQLGNGGTSLDTESPSLVDTSTMIGNKLFVRLSAGRWHTCGLTADGRVYCWGLDQYGELGDGGVVLSTQSPSLVDISTISGNKAFVKITAGDAHTCGLTADGVAYCWGLDSRGQLGNGGTSQSTQSPSPVDTSIILGNKAFVQLTLGLFHTCGLAADHMSYCWGEDEKGQLGNGGDSQNTESPLPVDVSGL